MTKFVVQKVSSSSLLCYEGCPYEYKMLYVDHVEVTIKTNVSAAVGKAYHRVIEEWHSTSEDFSRPDLTLRWKDVFEDELSQKDVEQPDKSYRSLLFNKGYSVLTMYYNRQKRDGLLVRPLGTEVEFKIPWNGIFITGKMDLIFPTVEIDDLKSGAMNLNQKQVDEDAQLTFYSMGYRWLRRQYPTLYPDLEKKLVLHYLAKDVKLETTRCRRHYDGLLTRIGNMIQNVVEENFVGCPSAENCKWCLYTKLCPFFK